MTKEPVRDAEKRPIKSLATHGRRMALQTLTLTRR